MVECMFDGFEQMRLTNEPADGRRACTPRH